MEKTMDDLIDEIIENYNRQNTKETGDVGSFIWGQNPDGRIFLGKIQADGTIKKTAFSKNKEDFFQLIDYS